MKQEDGFRVCSDGAGKESPAVVEVWILEKLFTGQMRMRTYAGLLRTPQFKNTLEEMGQHFLNIPHLKPHCRGFPGYKDTNVNF